jgi:hypothetical protein
VDIEQRKYLQSLLACAARTHETYTRPPKPSIVRKAERISNRWQQDQRNKQYRLTKRVEKAKRKLAELILFGDAAKSLKAIRAFEKKKF